MATNTGYKGWLTLKKVVHGGSHDGEALDDNDNLVSQSGLPQSTKANNTGDPDYVAPILDETSCPVP